MQFIVTKQSNVPETNIRSLQSNKSWLSLYLAWCIKLVSNMQFQGCIW